MTAPLRIKITDGVDAKEEARALFEANKRGQAAALVVVARGGEVETNDIAQALGISPGGAAHHITRLKIAGLVVDVGRDEFEEMLEGLNDLPPVGVDDAADRRGK